MAAFTPRATASLARNTLGRRAFSSSSPNMTKVAVLGASGGIGQPLSLLLKQNPLVSDLRLYDIRQAAGVAADCSHVNTPAKVAGYGPENDGLTKTLDGTEVIVIPAGVPRKPGMTRDDLFNTNASIVRDLAKAAAEVSPKAKLLIISNPVNSTVPIVAEVFKKAGVFDPTRLFGVTTLDVVRASTFVSEITGTKPADINIHVVGGHSGETIVPLLSQNKHAAQITGQQWKDLVKRIQFGGDEVVKAKDGAGSATLSMAYAGAEFANALLRASAGEQGIVQPTFVKSPHFESQGVEYFASNVKLSADGVQEILPLGPVTAQEEELLKVAVDGLKKNIAAGEKFMDSGN